MMVRWSHRLRVPSSCHSSDVTDRHIASLRKILSHVQAIEAKQIFPLHRCDKLIPYSSSIQVLLPKLHGRPSMCQVVRR